ncbi:putative ATP-dependent RNA helicase DHX30 isoform X2 [Orussus abietinus]|uniref:putative ATP-dependent RNA helicase DHX30 isoform X2 n=1 Tax=Orussus abietinus TaxID=222816 RepID=UPI000C7162A1|nr:putative ATP-dependent RNA helicase DHX30 isoform X2 [Orussus abietinus]
MLRYQVVCSLEWSMTTRYFGIAKRYIINKRRFILQSKCDSEFIPLLPIRFVHSSSLNYARVANVGRSNSNSLTSSECSSKKTNDLRYDASNLETVNFKQEKSMKKIYNELINNVEDKTVAEKYEICIKDVEKKFPNATGQINRIYTMVARELNATNVISTRFTKDVKNSKMNWTCTRRVLWPMDMTFTSTASNKSSAERMSSLQCLQWLLMNKKLVNGLPLIFDVSKVMKLNEMPVDIHLNSDALKELNDLLCRYDEVIKPMMKDKTEITVGALKDLKPQILDPIGDNLLNPSSFVHYIKRCSDLNERLSTRKSAEQMTDLPISKYREQICDMVKKNRILVIKGDTGCGKTTQVPQIILDSFTENGRAADCNIIVCQPRRITAISLARRVASERNEKVGDVVGYQVRFNACNPIKPGKILFCTNGILLRKLQNNPDLIGCSHVILDEAHERSLTTDFLMVLLRRALQRNPSLKLIVMSATINTELFQKFFNCPSLDVPGRTFPVKMHFLEDMERLGIDVQKSEMDHLPRIPVVNFDQVINLISWICETQPPGGILCFLPGWAEIVATENRLSKIGLRGQHVVLTLHSRMSNLEQSQAFQKVSPDVRKIILCTNIAETGITVNDIVYVIDTAIHKENYMNEYGQALIENQWVSKANIDQRKGRAGRVQSGMSFHLLKKSWYRLLDAYPTPEIQRVSLMKAALDCKTYSDEWVEDFMADFPEPPKDSSVRSAVAELKQIGALDEEENLTALGRRIALFSLHPRLSKALLFSCIFQCVNPMLTIISVFSTAESLFRNSLDGKRNIRDVKKRYHPSSDHLAYVWIFKQFEVYFNRAFIKGKEFCLRNELLPEKLFGLIKVRENFANQLFTSRILSETDEYDNLESKWNDCSYYDELVRGVLFSGVEQILRQRDLEVQNGIARTNSNFFITRRGHKASLTPESVNYKKNSWPSQFLTCINTSRCSERRTIIVRESSIITPLTVLLFSQSPVNRYRDTSDGGPERTVLTVDRLKFVCDTEQADCLLRLRHIMWSLVNFFVENQETTTMVQNSRLCAIEEYKQNYLQALGKILQSEASTIDSSNSESEDTDESRYMEACASETNNSDC